ncbi:MAG: hypothetical protein H0X29_05120 [Parachlamydiaceae bacterium]|nr:hypothetical protein [Parachlamydiaceae bacterium]
MAIDPITGEVILTPAAYKEHNIQALIELSYVKAANETLASNLSSLNTALTTTKDVMDTFAGLQGLHNAITVVGKPPFDFDYLGKDSTAYYAAAKDYYGTSVDPSFAYAEGSSAQIQFSSDIAKLKAKLSAQIPLLSATTPLLPLNQGGGEDPNSLLSKVRAVLKDLTDNDVSTYEGQKAWVEDKYPALTTTDSSTSGLIQQRLTFGITAGQSLNDTQKETVRRYLFLFEEYYKSASAVLQKISQIIEKMGQSISR